MGGLLQRFQRHAGDKQVLEQRKHRKLRAVVQQHPAGAIEIAEGIVDGVEAGQSAAGDSAEAPLPWFASVLPALPNLDIIRETSRPIPR